MQVSLYLLIIATDYELERYNIKKQDHINKGTLEQWEKKNPNEANINGYITALRQSEANYISEVRRLSEINKEWNRGIASKLPTPAESKHNLRDCDMDTPDNKRNKG